MIETDIISEGHDMNDSINTAQFLNDRLSDTALTAV